VITGIVLSGSPSSAVLAEGPGPAQGLTGTVSGTGLIIVNNIPISGPTTVSTGSTVLTGPDGDALIDLGTLGSVKLRPNGSIKLVLAPNSAQVLMEYCTSLTQTSPAGVTGQIQMSKPEKVEVSVSAGRAWVNTEQQPGRSGKHKLKAVTHRTIHSVRDVSSDVSVTGQSIVTVGCCQCCFVERRLSN
jgi:hypothetical protein